MESKTIGDLPKLNLKDSEHLALALEIMKQSIHMIDLDYARVVHKGLLEDANFKDSAAALNPMYIPKKTELLRLQASALGKLIEYIELLKLIDVLKREVKGEIDIKENLVKIFS